MPKLDSLALIRASSATIDQNAAAGPDAVNTVTPEAGSVSEAERRKLGEWLIELRNGGGYCCVQSLAQAQGVYPGLNLFPPPQA